MLNRSGYIQALVANINAQAGLVLDLSFLTKGLSLSGVMAYQTNSVNQTTTTQNLSAMFVQKISPSWIFLC